MRAKTLLAALFLASLGVIAVLVFRALPHRLVAGSGAPKAEVLAAAVSLKAGTLLRSEDVAWRPLAGSWRPGLIARPSAAARRKNPALDEETRAKIYGGGLRVAVAAGQPILKGDVARPGDRDFLRVVLTPGERAISIPVKTGGASTGLLAPGDHVDVILTQRFGDKQPLPRRSVSETIVQDLRVLAIDAPHKKTPGFGRTVTLEVTPREAEAVNTATVLGRLSLTLRPSTSLQSASAVSPIWAGDVSPVLGDAASPKPVVAQRLTVDVIRGANTQAVKR